MCPHSGSISVSPVALMSARSFQFLLNYNQCPDAPFLSKPPFGRPSVDVSMLGRAGGGTVHVCYTVNVCYTSSNFSTVKLPPTCVLCLTPAELLAAGTWVRVRGTYLLLLGLLLSCGCFSFSFIFNFFFFLPILRDNIKLIFPPKSLHD